jgi:hypothetical protein
MPAARVGDMCICTGPPLGGSPAARIGDMTAHGGVIVSGAPTVIIGGKTSWVSDLSLDRHVPRRGVDCQVGALSLAHRLEEELIRRQRSGLPQGIEDPRRGDRHDQLRQA